MENSKSVNGEGRSVKIPEGWEETSIGEFCHFTYGKNLPQKTRDDSGSVPVFGSNGIVGVHSKPYVNQPGIIIGRKGTVGAVTFSTKPFWPIDTTFYVTEAEHRDLRYTFYLLSSIGLEHMNADSAVPGLNRDAAHSRTVLIPPLTEQKAIAHILGSLDDKIELNRRMNETLEALAQALFKSWFVDFDPVIDNALATGNEIPEELKERADIREALGDARKPMPEEIQNLFPSEFEHTEEMGWIPMGWRVSESGKLFDVRDGTHDSPKQVASGKYLITSRHITGNTIDFSKAYLISDADFEQVNKRSKVDRYDILLTMIGTVGVPFLVLEDEINFAIKNIGLFKTCINRSLSVFFYLHLKTVFMTQFLESRMAGTTQKYLTLGILRKLPLLEFSPKLFELFGKEALPIFDRIHFNNENSRHLRILRDTLLPQLLSGEIRIPEADLSACGHAQAGKLVEDLDRNGGGNGKS